ncbi:MULTISPECIES: sigma-70 family RNA polymerase sigma factor [Exiguobacterium]|uniref:sigma-70 family RNA polymerase sigma factor n=1 Tax=Exiguobacterium TaxID=33986 RepID=UPI001BEA2C9E|nr:MULTISPECIES: sigma-70 family RNA polymerase sigma factor [Exiguobacterium]MCT4776360.1 sigma-70 family RNA polymerase sigma factor [Exiguobacterium aquaticum]MCT4789240.1 sigma-70 family RNA polymerase sigma factor [Exiguobacterium mexicanum]
MTETKLILFSDGTSKELTFEEVRKLHRPMAIKEMRKANSKSLYNPIEEEDFMQEMELEIWRAFEQYDPDLNYCFSTYLQYKLLKGVRNVTYSRYAKKNQHNGLFSMNATQNENDLRLEDMFVSEESASNNFFFKELFEIIQKNVPSDSEKELLLILLNKKEHSVQDYATRHRITRQAANQRVVKLRKKLQKIIKNEYLT